MNITILLTACINPNTNDILAINDANERKAQYIDAFNFYINNTSYDIVFVENSGVNISNEIITPSLPNRKIEILTYKSKPMPIDKGKGYREMEILKYAIENSKIIQNSDIIIKGTGRLKLLNINKIVPTLKNYKQFISAWISIKNQTSDSRFFFCSIDFLQFFIKFQEKIDKKCNFEEILCFAIMQWKKKNGNFIYPCLWYNIEGIGGGYGQIYNFSKRQYYTKCIKNLLYRLLFKLGYWPKHK